MSCRDRLLVPGPWSRLGDCLPPERGSTGLGIKTGAALLNGQAGREIAEEGSEAAGGLRALPRVKWGKRTRGSGARSYALFDLMGCRSNSRRLRLLSLCLWSAVRCWLASRCSHWWNDKLAVVVPVGEYSPSRLMAGGQGGSVCLGERGPCRSTAAASAAVAWEQTGPWGMATGSWRAPSSCQPRARRKRNGACLSGNT